MRTLLADGNFKQEHLKMKSPGDDVALADGHGYMVTKEPFDRYINEAPVTRVQVRASHCLAIATLTYHCRRPPVMNTMRLKVRMRAAPILMPLGLAPLRALAMDVFILTLRSTSRKARGTSRHTLRDSC